MLNAHPQIAVPPESRFVVELYRENDEVAAEDFLQFLSAHRMFAAWRLSIDDVREEIGPSSRLHYSDAIESAYRAYAKKRGKTCWGDKTPRYIEHIPLLARLFPEARFVHQVRDGRNVALSYTDVPFGPKTVAGAAALWRHRLAAGMRDGRPLGRAQYIELRYEDLVREPTAYSKQLCDFLGVEFDQKMVDYPRFPDSDVLDRATRYNPHVTKPPTTDVRSWDREMSPRQIEVFETVAGDILEEFDYPRRFPHVRLRARLAAFAGHLDVRAHRLRSRLR
jgi:hypothetical protein